MIGFLLLYFYIRRLLAPIGKLQVATLEVSQGRLGHRIREPSSTEFEQLFSAFNAMAARLQALFANDVLLLGNLSHDLKFYLTRLKMTAEVDVVDHEAWRTIIDNLLDNARKYGVAIRIALTGEAGRFCLSVTNRTELVLGADQLELLLQPFYRGDAA